MLNEAFIRKNLLLKDGNKVIGIYGTGLAGKRTFEALSNLKTEIRFFLDGDSNKIGKTFCDKEIKDLNSISKDAVILIAANPCYRIHERLEKAGIEQWEYVDPEYLYLYSEGFDSNKIQEIYKTNEQSIRRAYEMLEDDVSRNTYEAILKHRMQHNLALINSVYNENQYFGNDVIGSVSGGFVDCGAFTGDTLKRFINQLEGGYRTNIMRLKQKKKTVMI